MLGRFAAMACVAALAACAGMESASRDTRGGASPAPAASIPTPPPPASQTLPPPSAAVTSSAPAAAAPAPPPPQASAETLQPRASAPPVEDEEEVTAVDTTQRSANDIVVPGVRERQVQPPRGDPRSVSERMEDVRAWDQCVTRVQAAYESDPMNPQLDSPEEYCRESLGMTNREAVPLSRSERRRN